MNGRREKKNSFILILVILFPFFHLWGEGALESSEKSWEGLLWLPKNNEIEEWKRDGEILTAPNPTELFKMINGGASLYVKYGFQSYCGQTYKNTRDVELEVSVFDQGNPQNARQLYQDPLVVPKPGRILENLGDEARVDERGLFHYGIEFIKDRYFVRIIIQDKSEGGLNIAVLFSRLISQKIK
jgi:hypothetical protein